MTATATAASASPRVRRFTAGIVIGNLPACLGSNVFRAGFKGSAHGGKMAEGLFVKPIRAITWTDVGGREAALIQRCAAGDEDACAELVTEHQRMVYQLSLNLLGDHNEALDLSQEVFLRVFRTIHSFRGQSALRTWIYRIVVNQARNRQRWWRRRHRSQQISLDEHLKDFGDFPEQTDVTSPHKMLGRKELAERIRSALENLPFDQRTAIVLREIDGLSYEEIGFSLGIAVGTVKSRLARAREALRAQLRDA
jgi:RNA polymerase sigma-70 factor, ECF subfamily